MYNDAHGTPAPHGSRGFLIGASNPPQENKASRQERGTKFTQTTYTAALIPLTDNDGETAVMGRDLHEFLELGRDYTTWFKKMATYGFIEGADYIVTTEETAGQPGSPNLGSWKSDHTKTRPANTRGNTHPTPAHLSGHKGQAGQASTHSSTGRTADSKPADPGSNPGEYARP